jgi:hypothetical protein
MFRSYEQLRPVTRCALAVSGPGQRHVARGLRGKPTWTTVVDIATTGQPTGPRDSEPEPFAWRPPVTHQTRIRCSVPLSRGLP